MQFALPHIMGWDQALTNHHPSPPAISKPRVERPHPDSEWERWSFLVAASWWRLLGISRRCCCEVWSIGVLEQCLRTLSAVCIRFLELKDLRPDEARWTVVFVRCMYNSTTPTKCLFLVELAVLCLLVICEWFLCLVRINWAWCSDLICLHLHMQKLIEHDTILHLNMFKLNKVRELGLPHPDALRETKTIGILN
jgi:hypothetical protein